MSPTFGLCSNFGHNFYREIHEGEHSDIVKCKNCSKEIHLNQDGDFEDVSETKVSILQVMHQLNLLRSRYSFRYKKQVYSI